MLIIRRKSGQWIRVTDGSGNDLLIKLFHVKKKSESGEEYLSLHVGFLDRDKNFNIQRLSVPPEEYRRS